MIFTTDIQYLMLVLSIANSNKGQRYKLIMAQCIQQFQ